MKKFAIVAAAIFAATLLSGLLPAQGHEKGEAAKTAKKGPLTWRTRPPAIQPACDEVLYPNGPAKVLAGLEGKCAREIYFLAPKKDCASHRAQFTPPRPGLKPPRALKAGEVFKHLECLTPKPGLDPAKGKEGPLVSERR